MRTDLVSAAVAEAINPISSVEAEEECVQVKSMIVKYLHKASKTSTWNAPWRELVQEFSENFVGSVWASLGERDWLEQVDFAGCIHAALQSYCRMSIWSL